MKIETLHDLLIAKLKALYDVESELAKALPKLAKAATAPALKEAFISHLDETRGHMTRLEEIFKSLDVKPAKLKSEGIRGIVKDGEWGVKSKMSESALDAFLIASGRTAEHYEMAGYMTAATWARLMGHIDMADILETTLREEEMADSKLSSIAETEVDDRAMEGGDVEEMEETGLNDEDE